MSPAPKTSRSTQETKPTDPIASVRAQALQPISENLSLAVQIDADGNDRAHRAAEPVR